MININVMYMLKFLKKWKENYTYIDKNGLRRYKDSDNLVHNWKQ